MDRQAHWENVYTSKSETEVSWFEESPALSLDLIRRAGATQRSAIIDIGGGASRLAERLVAEGFEDVTVLDISGAALAVARGWLGVRASEIRWVVADVTRWEAPSRFDIWHDRAVLHFLVEADERARYAACLRQGLLVGGRAIIGTFAPDGPEKCSGLPVMRHDAASLGKMLGEGFELIDSIRHEHLTPTGGRQRFQFSMFRKSS